MAKRRSSGVRRVARRVAGYAKRGYKRATNFVTAGVVPLLDIGFSFGYGYLRSKISGNSMFQKVLSWVPFGGDYKDNLVLGGLAYAIAYFFKPSNPYVKAGLKTVVLSEAFICGMKMDAGASFTTTNTQAIGKAVGDYL